MDKFRFDPEPATVPAGRVVVRFVNESDQGHLPALVALPEDLPPIAQQVQGSDRRNVEEVAHTTGIAPGAFGSFAVDLIPNQRYAFVCFAETADKERHSVKGMTWEFRTSSVPVPRGPGS